MSDFDVFEGNDTSLFFSNHAKDLDLFDLSNQYKHLWKLPETSPAHRAVLLLIGKGISPENYYKIVSKIEASIGKKEINKHSFGIRDIKLKEFGLSTDKIIGIRKILDLPEVTSKTLCKVKEGGIYLVKAFKIFYEEEDDIFLQEDYLVRKNLSVLFFKDKLMSEAEARKLSTNWAGHKSQISYFLSRLKPTGSAKILAEEPLTECDFFGKDKI